MEAVELRAAALAETSGKSVRHAVMNRKIAITTLSFRRGDESIRLADVEGIVRRGDFSKATADILWRAKKITSHENAFTKFKFTHCVNFTNICYMYLKTQIRFTIQQLVHCLQNSCDSQLVRQNDFKFEYGSGAGGTVPRSFVICKCIQVHFASDFCNSRAGC